MRQSNMKKKATDIATTKYDEHRERKNVSYTWSIQIYRSALFNLISMAGAPHKVIRICSCSWHAHAHLNVPLISIRISLDMMLQSSVARVTDVLCSCSRRVHVRGQLQSSVIVGLENLGLYRYLLYSMLKTSTMMSRTMLLSLDIAIG